MKVPGMKYLKIKIFRDLRVFMRSTLPWFAEIIFKLQLQMYPETN